MNRSSFHKIIRKIWGEIISGKLKQLYWLKTKKPNHHDEYK